MPARFSVEAQFKGSDAGMSSAISKLERRISTFASNASSSLKSIDQANDKIWSGLGALAAKAAAVGVVFGGMAGTAAYNIGKTGADFEQAITNVGAVSLSTRKEIRALENEALELGLKTKFTATEAANAMETMARAGFTNAEVLAGIPGLLSAAAAEGITPGEVTEVVAATIKGMGLAATETNRVADVFALASAKTKSSILSLGESMSTVGPVAAQLGVSLEEATSAVALLQDAGLDASVSGSAVATMLTKLAKPSAEVSAQMKQFGVSFQDAHGNMLPFVEVLKNIQMGAKKSGGNLQQMGFFSELAGMRGQKAALGLAKAFQSGKFDTLNDQLKNAAGSAEKMANIRMDTLEGDLTLLNSSLDIVKISLFGIAGGGLRDVVQRTNEWVIANKDLIASKFVEYLGNAKFAVELFANGAARGFAEARTAFAPVVWLFGVFGKHMSDSGTWPEKVRLIGEAFGFLGGVAVAFVAFTVAVKAARVAVFALELATKGASAATWLWNAAIGANKVATSSSTVVTIVSTAATNAGRLAMIGSTLALRAKNVVTFVAFAATTRFTVAQVASKVAEFAGAAATWVANTARSAWMAVTVLATVATGAYETATLTSTAATEAGTIATDLATVSVGAFLVTVGAAVAAVGSLYAAWTQWKALESVSGGWEGVKAGVGGVLAGEGYFKGVDDYQNEVARNEARASGALPPDIASPAPQVASPSAGFYAQNPEAAPAGEGFYGELTVRADPGTSAAVTKAPKGGHQLKLAPSGAF